MNIWLKSILAGLVVGTIFFVFYKGSSFKIHYTIQVVQKSTTGSTTGEIINALQQRLKKLASVVSIHESGKDKLDIVVADVRDTIQTRQAIEDNTKLEIREIYTMQQLVISFQTIDEKLMGILNIDSGTAKPGEALVSREKHLANYIMFGMDAGESSFIGAVYEKDTTLVNKVLNAPESLHALPKDILFRYGSPESYRSGDKQLKVFYLYAIKTNNAEARLSNRHIVFAEASKNVAGHPEVLFRFNASGSRIWETMTTKNTGQFLAILVDNQVVSAPKVLSPITGGSASMSGIFTMPEAKKLANQLNSGYLPAYLHVAKTVVTPEPGPASGGKKLLLTGLLILTGTSVAFFIFKGLRNK